MTECARGDLRDLLPDLLHGTISPDAAAGVRAHLLTCDTCAGELELLRAARTMLDQRAPTIDVARVVSAIAPYQPHSGGGLSWRVAAAVAVLAVGGLAYALHQSTRVSERMTASGPVVDSGVKSGREVAQLESTTVARAPARTPTEDSVHRTRGSHGASPMVASAVTDSAVGSSKVAFTSSLSDLDDADVEALLRQVNDLSAVPDSNPSQLVDIGATEER